MTLSSPHVHLLQESNYFTPQGEFRVDSGGSQTLLNCLMYKLCYYRFGEVQVSTITYEYTPHNAISGSWLSLIPIHLTVMQYTFLFSSIQLDFHHPSGYDRTRGVEIGNKNVRLNRLDEAYTSEHWLVRIYK